MADRARFDVILGDRVSASARRQAMALSELTKALQTTASAARASAIVAPVTVATAATRARTSTGPRAAPPSNGAENSEAKAAQKRAREREKTANEQARTAERVRKAVEAAKVKVERAESASERALLAMFRRGTTGRSSALAGRLSAGVRDVGRQREGGGGAGFLGAFSRAGLAAGAVMAVAGAAREAAAAFGHMSVEAAGAYLSIARFRQDSITSLTTVLGNAVAARRAFNNALVIANQTPLDPQQVIGAMTQLAVGGFQERELAPLVAAASDIAAARGQAASDALVRVVTQIHGLGRVTRGDITMQALTAGLNAQDIFGDIARQMNLGTGAAGLRAAERAVTKGRVNDSVAIAAFMASVRRRYDGGRALGTFARNNSNTLTGSFSNLRGSMFTLLASANLEATPGLVAVKNAVLAVTGALDMGSATGRRFRGVIISAANAVGVGLFGGINEGSVRAGFEYMLPVLEGGVRMLREGLTLGRAFVDGFLPGLSAGLYPVRAAITSFGSNASNVYLLEKAMRGLGRTVGFVAGLFGTVAAFATAVVGVLTGPAVFIASIPGMLAGAADAVWNFGGAAGTAIIDGFVLAIRSGAGAIASAVSDTFGGAVTSARTELGWHSPSTVFRAAGEAVTEGFALGVGGNRAAARDAVARLVSPAGLGAGAGAGAAPGRGGITVHINVDGRGKSDDAIAETIVEKLTAAFEGFALMGATD